MTAPEPKPSSSPTQGQGWGPRPLMLTGLLIVSIGQCLPFSKDHHWLDSNYESTRWEVGHTGHDSDGDRTGVTTHEVRGYGGEVGLQQNPAAWLALLALWLAFLSPIYRSAKISRWIWWGGVAALLLCCGGPTLLDAIGGWVSSVGIALAVLAAYRQGKAI